MKDTEKTDLPALAAAPIPAQKIAPSAPVADTLAIQATVLTTAPRQVTRAVEFSPWFPPTQRKSIALPTRPASFLPPPPPPKAALAALDALSVPRELERKIMAELKTELTAKLKSEPEPKPEAGPKSESQGQYKAGSILEVTPTITVREPSVIEELAFLSNPDSSIDPTSVTEPTSIPVSRKRRSKHLPAFLSLGIGLSLLGAHSFITHASKQVEIAAAPKPAVAHLTGTISAPTLLAKDDSTPVPPQAILPVVDQVHLAAMSPQREAVIDPHSAGRNEKVAMLVETITDKVYLRSGPSQKYRRLGFARNEFGYSVTGRTKDWLKIEIPGQPGPSAWISSEFVRPLAH